MHLIVGLGNPGKKYSYNRHNVGFMCLESVVDTYRLDKSTNQFKSDVYKGSIGDNKLIAIEPMTFMNDSGKAVSSFANYYKISVDRVIVIHDELDLPLGAVRIGISNGTAGHNGLRSINSMMENKYIKVRVGIGRPEYKEMVSGYVLSDFSSEERLLLEKVKKNISEFLPLILKGEVEKFVKEVNR